MYSIKLPFNNELHTCPKYLSSMEEMTIFPWNSVNVYLLPAAERDRELGDGAFTTNCEIRTSAVLLLTLSNFI